MRPAARQKLPSLRLRTAAEPAAFCKLKRSLSRICIPPHRHLNCLNANVPRDRRFVYVVKTTHSDPNFYVGLTSDVPRAWRITTPAGVLTRPHGVRGYCTW
jgi:hypothetical protein